MSDPVCDPYAGWGAINNKWAHCRGGEDACLTAELATLGPTYAYVGIWTSWGVWEGRAIHKGSFVEYEENGTVWRVHCDGLVHSMNQANIRICYIPSEAPPDADVIKVGDTASVDGHTFQLLELVCGTNARIVARVDGVLHSSKAVIVAGSLLVQFPIVGLTVGGMYAGVKTLGGVCSLTLDSMATGGLTKQDQKDNEERAQQEYIYPDGTAPTPEQTEAADDEAEERTASWLNSDYVEKVRQLTAGEIARPEFTKWLKDTTYNLKLVILEEEFYRGNFSLNIPSIVMAGDVDITGTAPQANQAVKIMAVKKLFGFDWAAKDTELDRATSGIDREYYTTVSLDEFGVVEVYGSIPKDWWAILDADIETERHTVLVVTPMILLALLAMLAMVLDKKYNFIGMFKKKRGKK